MPKKQKQKLPKRPPEPDAWCCPACGKIYLTYAAAKCCREIPSPLYITYA